MPLRLTGRIAILVVSVLIFIPGCKNEGVADPPADWTGNGLVEKGAKWWVTGTDTSDVFPNLETFTSMEIGRDTVFTLEALANGTTDVVLQALRNEYLPLFRHDPVLMDSLFERYVAPPVRAAPVSMGNDPRTRLLELKKEGYNRLRRRFREPFTKLVIGGDIPLIYPQYIRDQGIGGLVTMQVRVNEDGDPTAIGVISSVDPVLNTQAMLATTKMKWAPAYLNSGPVPSWVRFSLKYDPEPAATE